MTHRSVTRILESFRGGSSWPVLVEASDGMRYVMKWRGTAEGPAANAADMIALRLARMVGIPVPTPVILDLSADLVEPKRDPELNDLIKRSVGTNLGIDEVRGPEPYRPERRLEIPQALRELVYRFDVLFLNIDRTDSNPNMVFSHAGPLFWDFAAVMAIRMLLEHRTLTENNFYPLLRRHPFHQHAEPGHIQFPHIEAGQLQAVVSDLPDDWFGADSDRGSVVAGIESLLADTPALLGRRMAAIDGVPLETDEERAIRSSANRRAFEAAVERIKKQGSSGPRNNP